MFVMIFLIYFKDIEQFDIHVVAEEEHKVVRLEKSWVLSFALIESLNICNFSCFCSFILGQHKVH